MTLSDEQRKQIELEAKASSKVYFSNGCENFEWVTYEDGFINAATAYTALCHQKDEEIARLRGRLQEIDHEIVKHFNHNYSAKKIQSIIADALKPI